MIRACLESVVDVVDEMVVYDTGSSDATVEIARGMGAKVFEGYWDGSFSRARNAALEHASGEWILVIDADEQFLGDPVALRALLEHQGAEVEAFLVAVENLHGAGNARSVHTGIRLFRRNVAHYRHRLHEQVVAIDDPERVLNISYLSGARVIHYGYVSEVFESKHKAERNLLLAKAALEDEGQSKAYGLMNYGRALESAGRSEESVETLKEAAAISDDPITHRLALKNLIHILARLGRFDEALEQVEQLRSISLVQIAADIAEGRVRISMGDAEAGLSLLARVPLRGRDDDGMEYTAHTLSAVRGEALASLGKFAEAADVVLEAIRSEGLFEADLSELAGWLIRAGRSPIEIVEVLDVVDLASVLGRLLHQPIDLADILLEGIWARFPDRLEPLAAAGRLAPRLPVARALTWSARLRARGLERACPLVVIARNQDLDPKVRILAGAAAFGSFGEHGVINAVHEARGRLDPVSLAEADEQIDRLAPGLLEADHVEAIISADEIVPATAITFLERGRSSTVTAVSKVAEFPRRGGVNIVGPFEGTSAEANAARSMAMALVNYGVEVSTTTYQSNGRSGTSTWTHFDSGEHPFDTTLLMISPEELASFVMDNGAAAFEKRYMIGLWLWDLEQASQMMSMAARMVHEIWVPSTFAADAISKVTDRLVRRMLLPAESNPHFAHAASDAEFVFLAGVDYEKGFERANPLGVVEAFSKAFYPGEGPKLVIETTHAHQYPAEHARLVEAASARSDVLVLGADPGQVFNSRAVDRSCFVSLHRSEGTGRLITSAMSLGIPTIATAHSFGAEIQDGRDSFPVSFSFAPIPESERWGTSGGQWAEPNLEDAAKAMRSAFDLPKVAKARALRAQKKADHIFSPSACAKAVQDRLAVIDHRRHADLMLHGA